MDNKNEYNELRRRGAGYSNLSRNNALRDSKGDSSKLKEGYNLGQDKCVSFKKDLESLTAKNATDVEKGDYAVLNYDFMDTKEMFEYLSNNLNTEEDLDLLGALLDFSKVKKFDVPYGNRKSYIPTWDYQVIGGKGWGRIVGGKQ